MSTIERDFLALGSEVLATSEPSPVLKERSDAIARRIQQLPQTAENLALINRFLSDFNLLRTVLQQPSIAAPYPS